MSVCVLFENVSPHPKTGGGLRFFNRPSERGAGGLRFLVAGLYLAFGAKRRKDLLREQVKAPPERALALC